MAEPNTARTQELDDDPVERAFLDAPTDDLPETEAERAMVAEARADHDAGVPMIPHASVRTVLDEWKRHGE